jgi:hypothetical protein
MKSITKMGHSSYSPDLTAYDCWIFARLKKCPEKHRFADNPDIQLNVITLLSGIPENA